MLGRRKGAGGGPPGGGGTGTPASRPGVVLPRGRGGGRVRPGGGRQVRRSRSQRLGGALRRGVAGSAGGKELAGGRRGCRGAGRRRGRRGGGGGAPGIHSPSAGPCTSSRGRHPPRSQLGAETSSGPALRRRARSPATTEGGAPSRAPWAQGLPPARPRAPLPDCPRPLSSGVPGAEQGAPSLPQPATAGCADSETQDRPGRRGVARGPRRLPLHLGGPSRRAGGTPGGERAGPRRQPRAGRRMKSPVRRPERPAR